MAQRAIKRALVTGANGFVGRPLCRALLARGFEVIGAVRSHAQVEPGCVRVVVPDLSHAIDWSSHLDGVSHVFHLAAYVHRTGEAPDQAEAANQALNHRAATQLAEQAFTGSVQRLVLVSSIKANGEVTYANPFTPTSEPQPEDAYGRSKLDGERAVRRLAAERGRECTIVRPPLVYGPGVRANFRALMVAVSRGVPLPLGRATLNRRNLIYVENLADCLVLAAEAPEAAQRVLLPTDGVALSTAELIRHIGNGLGKPARLLPVPNELLVLAGKLSGRSGMTRRLLESLEIDDPFLRDNLGWRAPVSVEQAMRETCQSFLEHPGP